MDASQLFEIQRWDFDEKHWETMKPGILVRFVTTGKLQTASKIKLRLQMCGDLVWVRRESPGQKVFKVARGRASYRRGAPSIDQVEPLLVRFLPARWFFLECLEQMAMDFFGKVEAFCL